MGDKIVGEILASQSQDPNIRTDIISALPSRDISDDNFNNIMALNIEEIVLTNLEAVTNSRLRVDPHEARQLEDVKIPRYLDDGNVEDWAKTLSCGFCKTNLSLGDQGVVMDSGTRVKKKTGFRVQRKLFYEPNFWKNHGILAENMLSFFMTEKF